ncbi:MAG TPA: histidinol dehydrogenase [Paraburkholderia sp.]|nr:histidinol dehydrogenase [Paraburkholderia sp.]
MIKHLKASKPIEAKAEIATQVHEYSQRFDKWLPTSFRLPDAEIAACIAQLLAEELDDIRFAHAQVRRFAEVQKSALRDVEVEALPGVIPGHKRSACAPIWQARRRASVRTA